MRLVLCTLLLLLAPAPLLPFPVCGQGYRVHACFPSPTGGAAGSAGHGLAIQATGTVSGTSQGTHIVLSHGPAPPLINLFRTPEEGDVNGSGIVDVVDALFTSRFFLGLPAPCSLVFHPVSADVDLDGSIDVVDAVGIGEMALGF